MERSKSGSKESMIKLPPTRYSNQPMGGSGYGNSMPQKNRLCVACCENVSVSQQRRLDMRKRRGRGWRNIQVGGREAADREGFPVPG